MPIEVTPAITVTLVVVGLSLGDVQLGMLMTALGYLGEIAQFLAVSWLIGAMLLGATIFLEIHQGTSLVSPNEAVEKVVEGARKVVS